MGFTTKIHASKSILTEILGETHDSTIMLALSQVSVENIMFLKLYDWDSAKLQKELLVNIAEILLKGDYLSEDEYADVLQCVNTSIPEEYIPYTFGMLAIQSHGIQKILELMLLNHVVIHGMDIKCRSPVDGLLKNLNNLDKTSARNILSVIIEGLEAYGWLTREEADEALKGLQPQNKNETYEKNSSIKKVFNLIHNGRVRIFFGNNKLTLSFEGDVIPDSGTRYHFYIEKMKGLGLLTENISILQDLSPVHKKMQN